MNSECGIHKFTLIYNDSNIVFEYKKIDESNIISDMKRVLSLEIKKPIKTDIKKIIIPTNIFEIYPFLKEEKNKSEVKNVTLKSDFGNFFHSFNTTYFKDKQTPLQLSLPFESLLKKDLVLLPEKKK